MNPNHFACEVVPTSDLKPGDEFWHGGGWWAARGDYEPHNGLFCGVEIIDDAGGEGREDTFDDEFVIVRKRAEEGYVFVHLKDGGRSRSEAAYTFEDAHLIAVGAAMADLGCRVTWYPIRSGEERQLWPPP